MDLYLAVWTQWHRCAWSGRRERLDWGAVEICAPRMGIEITPELWSDILYCESIALDQEAKEAEKNARNKRHHE